jgi:uncharacterized membrane protein YgcG
MKAKFPFITFLALVLGLIPVFNCQAQESSPEFRFPPGVDWNNATPDQIADAVFNTVKKNLNAAPEIAAAGIGLADQTGRWPRNASQDGKPYVPPDGSSSEPGIEEIASVITDAASRANPAMAPQIQSAVANAISSLPPAGSGSSSGGGAEGGGGGVTAPPPIFGGGGGGSSTSSTSN